MAPKWCWRHKSVRIHITAYKIVFNMTTNNETKFSSCKIPYTNNILHPASSHYFRSHKKLFQAGNINVNVRPDLLYFRIWGVYSKTYQNIGYGRLKTAKTLCTSSRRLVWWNVIHYMKNSVVLPALKAEGQKILNDPRMFHIHVVNFNPI